MNLSHWDEKKRNEIKRLALQKMAEMKATCNLGGCNNHSGHEYCNVDDAWAYALARAADELSEAESTPTTSPSTRLITLLLAFISASLTGCQAPATQTATATTSTLAASSKGCPSYDLAGTWTETVNPGSHASTGTFDKTSCSLSVTYCNTTMTLAGAANPAFTAWAAVEVTVQADGSVPPACLQPGQYSCTAVTAYNGSGVRQLAINCGVTHTWLKQ